MSDAATLDIKGIKELDAALAALDKKVANKVLAKAVRDGGKVILDQAKENAPEDTGALEKSIKVRSAKGQPKGSKGVVVGVGKKWFQGDTYYGSFLEFGYKHGSRRLASERRKPIEGLHYIERAYQERGVDAADVLVKSLAEGIAAATEEARKESGA